MSWELPLLTSLLITILGFCWVFYNITTSTYLKVAALLLIPLATCLGPAPALTRIYTTAFQQFTHLSFDALITTHSRMVLTLGAVVWLLHRSWQTLWKPVPELINILGVDVPEPPDVSLAGIRSNAATLSWTRPQTNRPVQRYLIQVNGIHVGETPGNETAITVTGLKPNHYYNLRVVAIGANNFQAASQTIRLRTFGKDGKPYLGNARLPTNFVNDDHLRVRSGDESSSSEGGTHFAAAVEAAPVLDGSSNTARDATNTAPGQRRNTINRRHSPSVASQDHPTVRQADPASPEASLNELNNQFEEIRQEIIDTQELLATEDRESQEHEDGLKKERDTKKLSLKDKEEQTAHLKTSIRTTMEQMRAAEKERAKREQQLKDKDAKKSKARVNIMRLENDIETMKKECESFQSQKSVLEKQRDSDVHDLDDEIDKLQEEHNQLEADLSNKGKLLNEMKEARKHLPGADDEQFRETDERSRRDWEQTRSSLHHQLVDETKTGHQLDQHCHHIAQQLAGFQQAVAYYNQQDPSNTDLDHSASNHPKRLSNDSNHVGLSPQDQYAMPEPPSQMPLGLSRVNFAGAPLFMPESADENQTEDDLKSMGGPLSPSAHAYLPSGIIDFDGPDPKASPAALLPESVTAGEEDPQSPASSMRSYSAFSSPHGSSHHLPFPQYQDNSDRASLNFNAPPAASLTSGHRLTSLLSGFQRSRNTKASADEGGPPIGSLRPGQSQSFPRGTDESDILGSRRRLSFSFKGHRNSTGPDGNPSLPLGQGSKSLSKRLNPFASSTSAIFDRDLDKSRPPSIASTDFPRPSTDSGSIWGAPGDASGSRLWSAETRWPSSRAGSRRPSIHGSPSALTTSLASADDEILYETELKDPHTSPSQVGIIGSRPSKGKASVSDSLSQRLNPNAPTFKGFFSKSKDKDRERDRSKDRIRDSKGKSKELSPSNFDFNGPDSPSDPRVSRDTLSVHTQTSVSASHESLPLDASSSNTNLELSASLPKESDNVNGIRKLLRKGSSSKFSLSSRLGKDSSLFKKGPGSATTNSDRNTTDHRSSIGDLEEFGEDPGTLGRSYESMASSPALGLPKSKDSKEGRMSNWRFMKKNKGKETATTPSKEKESMEMDRPVGPLDEE